MTQDCPTHPVPGIFPKEKKNQRKDMVERRKMFPAILSGPWQQLGNHQDIQNIGMVDKMTLPSTNIHTTFLQVKKGISQL